jgi:hypothetical protein
LQKNVLEGVSSLMWRNVDGNCFSNKIEFSFPLDYGFIDLFCSAYKATRNTNMTFTSPGDKINLLCLVLLQSIELK